MAKSAGNSGKDRIRGGARSLSERDNDRENFDRRLEQARSRHGIEPDDGKARGSAMGTAFRISTELVAGLVVGGLIGWQLDKWLGSSPVFLLVFFLLGAAAGILNVVRTAWNMQASAKALAEQKDPGSGPEDK